MERKNIALGIDLGTTYSAMAYIDEFGQAKVIPNDANDRITPSVVYFENKDNIIVGKEAKNVLHYEPERVVAFVKRDMGQKKDSVRMNDLTGEYHPYLFDGYTYSPEEISSLILKKMKKDAENYFNGQEIKDVVITVPAYFNDTERNATKIAGQIAGFNVLQILNEPTAAAYAYGITSIADKPQKVFVFDLGGGTFDVTVLDIGVNGSQKSIEVISTDGDHKLGGKDWDEKIISYVSEEYINTHGTDPRDDTEAYGALIEGAEAAKISLSKKEKAKVVIKPSDGPSMPVEISREKFNELCEGLIEQIDSLCKSVLRNSGNLSWADIDTVLLAGGSTRMPMIVDYLAKESGKDIQTNLVNPDECVALGAAFAAVNRQVETGIDTGIQASVIAASIGTISVTDVLSHSLGNIAIDNTTKKERNFILLKKNEKVPCKRTQRFGTLQENQPSVLFEFTEGEGDERDEVRIIQEATLEIVTPLPLGAPLDVTFEMTKEGWLNVTARDVSNNREISVRIDRTDGLSKEDILKAKNKVSAISIE